MKVYQKVLPLITLLIVSIFWQCKAVVPGDSTIKGMVTFPIGAAVKVNYLKNDAAYRKLLVREFNSVTPENAMKAASIHPSKDVYNFDDADYIVSFAKQNGMRVHGHTLNWPNHDPKWVADFKGDTKDWEALLKSHIQTVVKHYKGKVASWDVVNEAFADNGTLKKSIWLEKLGPGYIGRCYQYAHEADPNALLFYNDYGQEYNARKRDAIIKMAVEFKAQGIPFDGFGLQMHTRIGVTDARLATAISVMGSTGLKIHISELEVAVNNYAQGKIIDSKLAISQAERYRAIFVALISLPKNQQFGITTWNVADKDSFRNSSSKITDFPLLFDMNYKPKEAYKAVLNAVQKVKIN